MAPRGSPSRRSLKISPSVFCSLSLVLAISSPAVWFILHPHESPYLQDETIIPERRVFKGGSAYTCGNYETELQASNFLKAKSGYKTGFYLGCADSIKLGPFIASLWNAKEEEVILINVGANKGYNIADWFELWLPQYNVTPHSWGLEYLFSKYPQSFQPWRLCGVCSDCRKQPLRWHHVREDAFSSISSDPKVKIFAVEPSETNFDLLKEFQAHVKYEGLKVLRLAASNVSGIGPFPVTRLGSELGSLETNRASERSQVRIITMEEFWDEQNLTAVHYLKIDTEGFDALVIQGAENILEGRLVQLLEFEYHGIGPWKGIQLENVVEKLDDFGYDCFLKVPDYAYVRLTRCFHDAYEFHNWSNVVCVDRRQTSLLMFVMSHSKWLP